MFIYHSCCVYWIHHISHTDMFTQGYIGVSTDPKLRFHHHLHKKTNPHLTNALKKYPKNEILWDIILIGQESYCYEIENKLRSNKKTGWNIDIGGGKPPSWKGRKHLEETKTKISKSNTGKNRSDETKKNLSESHKGKTTWQKGKPSCMRGIPRSNEIKLKISESKKFTKYNTWKITSPDNIEIIVFNLRQFCRENNLNRESIKKKNGSKGWKAVKL